MRKPGINIEDTKQFILQNQGKDLTFKINLGRNKFVEKQATICDVYNGLFTIKPQNEPLASFSYSDFLCNRIAVVDVCNN